MKWAHSIKKAICRCCWIGLWPCSVKVKFWLLRYLRTKPLSLVWILHFKRNQIWDILGLFQISFRLQSIPIIPIFQDFSHLKNTVSNTSVCEPFPMTNDVASPMRKDLFLKNTLHNTWGCAYHLLTSMYTSQIRNMRKKGQNSCNQMRGITFSKTHTFVVYKTCVVEEACRELLHTQAIDHLKFWRVNSFHSHWVQWLKDSSPPRPAKGMKMQRCYLLHSVCATRESKTPKRGYIKLSTNFID